MEIARACNIHPTTVARWKKESVEKGVRKFGKDRTVAEYERNVREMEQLLVRKQALLESSLDGTSCRERVALVRKHALRYGLNQTVAALDLLESMSYSENGARVAKGDRDGVHRVGEPVGDRVWQDLQRETP